VIVLGLAVVPAPASAGVPPTPLLTTAPFLVLPGGSVTLTGAAVTCPSLSDSLELDVPGLSTTQALVAGEPISAVVPTTTSTASAIYDVAVTCTGVDGGTPATVAKGWISVASSTGSPPSEGSFDVSSADLTWKEVCEVSGAGFAPESEVQVWMYSTPQLLGTFNASATGSLVGSVAMPPGTALGSHTMVLAGQDSTGRPLFLTVGITIGQAAGTPTSTTSTTVAGAAVPTTAPPSTTPGATTTAATLPETGGNGELALVGAVLLLVGTAAVAGSRSIGRRQGVR
jgi:hypothetical protein